MIDRIAAIDMLWRQWLRRRAASRHRGVRAPRRSIRCSAPIIKAKVLAFHGWDDPMAPPEAVVALGHEMTAAGADWQLHAYGNVAHGFTNPAAAQLAIDGVEYNALAAERSWTSLINFLEEIFG